MRIQELLKQIYTIIFDDFGWIILIPHQSVNVIGVRTGVLVYIFEQQKRFH